MLEKPELPALKLSWDAESQDVVMQFKPEEFKNWDFVLAVLEMAKGKAEFQRQIAQMQALHQAQMQAAHEQQMRGRLKL